MEIKANSNNKYSKSVRYFSKQDTNINEKSEDVLNRQEWILSDFTIFNLILIIRLCAVFTTSISDCDETFNYWEPTHFLLFGKSHQTWEYDPNFALRSYFYLIWIWIEITAFAAFFQPCRKKEYRHILSWDYCVKNSNQSDCPDRHNGESYFDLKWNLRLHKIEIRFSTVTIWTVGLIWIFDTIVSWQYETTLLLYSKAEKRPWRPQ